MDSREVLTPLLLLGGGAFLVYLVARFISRRNGVLATVTAVVYALSLVSVCRLWAHVSTGHYPVWAPGAAEAPILQAEPGALLLGGLGLFLGVLVALYSGRYLALDRRYENYYPLLLSLSAGMTGMVMAIDLFTLYMFTMLTSGAAYVLVAFRRSTETAIEAGFKYVIMGGLGGILILTGIGHIYRQTGSLTLPLKAMVQGPWPRVGLAFLIAGYGIKSALVPSHTWLPDAHGRAPSSISTLLSGIIIQANLYALLKVGLGVGWPARQLGWLLIVWSLVNMTVGNILGLVQRYGKRLLGYSSIAQVGYMMMALGLGLVYDSAEAVSTGLYLVVVHGIMKGLAFLCKGVFHFYCDVTLIGDLRGMGRRLPLTAGCFVVALAGLAGVPPLAGFVGKWQLLSSATTGMDSIIWLAVAVVVLNSLLSLGYYLPLIGLVLRSDGGEGSRIHVSPWMGVPMIALATLVVVVGVFPQPVLDLTNEAARFLLAWGG